MGRPRTTAAPPAARPRHRLATRAAVGPTLVAGLLLTPGLAAPAGADDARDDRAEVAVVALSGQVVRLVAEPPRPASGAPGEDGHAHHDDTPGQPHASSPHVADSWGLQLPDGDLVGVDGLAGSGAGVGERVRLTVDVPAEVTAAVVDVVGERRLDAARQRPASQGSALGEAVLAAAAQEAVALPVTPGSVEVTAAAPEPLAAAATPPARPVTVAVVRTGEGSERAPTDAEVAAMVARTSDYWSDQSAGQVTFRLAGPPVRYSTGIRCTWGWDIFTEAKRRTGWGGGQREHLVLVLVDEAGQGCSYGLGSVGWGLDAGGVSYLANAGDLSLSAHEIGHNLSFEHANAVECTSGARQDFAGDLPQSPCSAREYGDTLDIMAGANQHTGALSAMVRARVGFLTPQERGDVREVGTSVVELAPLAGPPATGLKDVSVTDPRTGVVYRLENRQAVGRDKGRLDMFRAASGLRVLRAQKGTRASLALDATPTARTGSPDTDRALRHGQVWRSASGGVEVRTVALPGGVVQARVSLAPSGQEHGALTTTTTLAEPSALAQGRSATVTGSVASAPGAVRPQGTVTLRLAGATTSAAVGADGTFTAGLVPAAGGPQVLSADFVPADAARWTPSAASRQVDVASGTTALAVAVGTAAGGAPDAATAAVLDVRLDPAAPDGTVTVTGTDGVLAEVGVREGRAQAVLPLLPAGSHDLLVAYDGGAAASPGSASLRLDVAPAAPLCRAQVASRASALEDLGRGTRRLLVAGFPAVGLPAVGLPAAGPAPVGLPTTAVAR
ncbi:hypothetical protein [Pseudokineococcus sp. 1T1Z-3]|uniref:hypothetical protein n=1 Tax=Pseudokineococcus sp. 1T1Z-3 TaxID=3132745 RepID=UPI0030A712B4